MTSEPVLVAMGTDGERHIQWTIEITLHRNTFIGFRYGMNNHNTAYNRATHQLKNVVVYSDNASRPTWGTTSLRNCASLPRPNP
jgi:hypothetical protein